MNIPTGAKLAIAIVVSQAAGIIGSFATVSSVSTWYVTLIQPTFAPPSWLFGPVWTILYTLMGIAAFVVWKQGLQHRAVRVALSVFLVQLALNTVWSLLFFGLQNPGAAFVEIVILWLAILVTLILFFRRSKLAGALLVPYLLWVSFAAYLNYTIYVLN